MPIFTFVARAADGLLLVASMDSSLDNHQSMNVYRSQAKQLLKKLSNESLAKCSIESPPYVFHYVILEVGWCIYIYIYIW